MNEMGPAEIQVPEAPPEMPAEAYEAPIEAVSDTAYNEPAESLADSYEGDSTLQEVPEAPEIEASSQEAIEPAGVDEMPEAPEIEASSQEAIEPAGVDEMPEVPEIEANSQEAIEPAGVDEMPEAPEIEANSQEAAESRGVDQLDEAHQIEVAPEKPESGASIEPETAEPPIEYDSVRDALQQNIENEKLRNHANSLYREGATVGDGGTAAALFHEKETGELVGGRSHEQKSEDHARGLGKLIEDGDVSITDREIAKDLHEDLSNANEAERA